MSLKLIAVLLLAVAAALARPQPQNTDGAHERDSFSEDDEEQKICISFKGNSMAEVTPIKGKDLPTQLILKLSGNSKQKLVHYKVLTLVEPGEGSFPDLKTDEHAKDASTTDIIQDKMTSSAGVLPFQVGALNSGSERVVRLKGAVRPAEGIETGANENALRSSTTDEIEGAVGITNFPTVTAESVALLVSTNENALRSTTADEIEGASGTTNFPTVTAESVALLMSSNAVTEAPKEWVTTAGDYNTQTTTVDIGELHAQSNEPNLSPDPERNYSKEGVNVTVTHNPEPTDASNSNKTVKELEVNDPTTEKYSESTTTIEGVDSTVSMYPQIYTEYSNTDHNRNNDSFSEQESMDLSSGANVASNANVPEIIENNGTFSSEIGSQIDGELSITTTTRNDEREVVSELEQDSPYQNRNDNFTLVQSTKELKDKDDFTTLKTTVLFGDSTEATKVIPPLTAQIDGGSVNLTNTYTISDSSSEARENGSSSVSKNQETSTQSIDVLAASNSSVIRNKLDEKETQITPGLPSEISTENTGLVTTINTSQIHEESFNTSSMSTSSDGTSMTQNTPTVGDLQGAIVQNSTKTPEIVMSESGDALSVKTSTIEPSEITTKVSGEFQSSKDETHKFTESTTSFEKSETMITNSYIEGDGIASKTLTTISKPITYTYQQSVHRNELNNQLEVQDTNKHVETAQHMGGTVSIDSDPVYTSSVYDEPIKEQVGNSGPTTTVTSTASAEDFRGLPVSQSEFKTSDEPDDTIPSTSENGEEEEIYTSPPLMNSNIPIDSYHSESPGTISPLNGPPQRELPAQHDPVNSTTQSYEPSELPSVNNSPDGPSQRDLVNPTSQTDGPSELPSVNLSPNGPPQRELPPQHDPVNPDGPPQRDLGNPTNQTYGPSEIPSVHNSPDGPPQRDLGNPNNQTYGPSELPSVNNSPNGPPQRELPPQHDPINPTTQTYEPSNGPSQRELEDWEKFNNFTIILPTRQSYLPIKYPFVANYYQQPGSYFQMYDREKRRTRIVQLPLARQL